MPFGSKLIGPNLDSLTSDLIAIVAMSVDVHIDNGSIIRLENDSGIG